MFHFDGDKNAHEFRIKSITKLNNKIKKNMKTMLKMKRNHAQRQRRMGRRRQRRREENEIGGMSKITGYRRICRFGANTNDTESPPLHTHAVYVTFCSNKICFHTTETAKQTDTQAGKHIYTKYQFEIIGANKSAQQYKLFRKSSPGCEKRTYCA